MQRFDDLPKHSNLGPDDHISERTEGELLLDITFAIVHPCCTILGD